MTMNEASSETPFVESIFHPSDFSKGSEQAFEHALALALHRDTSLTILHAGPEGGAGAWSDFPSVRGTLERWGLLEKGSSRTAVSHELSMRVKKVNLRKRHPLSAVIEYLDEHPTELIVLATEGREGPARWIHPSTAEAMARRSETMTLFVPVSSRGFVSSDDGKILLRRILVPVDLQPDPSHALVYAERASRMSESTPVEIVMLHVGETAAMPRREMRDLPSSTWRELRTSGDIVEEIVRAAEEQTMDLVVMATRGHHGILDALRGSVTEQVLRRARCPVLAVPVRPGVL
jgi:nucleotide-binding universal stress UspA family protein